jgi:hypothetical protein
VNQIPFSAIVTPDGVSFTSISGKAINIAASDSDDYKEILKTIKAIGGAIDTKDPAMEDQLRHRLETIAEPAKMIADAAEGNVSVTGGVVHYKGNAVRNVITDRILWGLREGHDMVPYLRFLDNLMENTSKRSVDGLYRFIESAKMGITQDGHIIAYKAVRDDYKDIHSGTFDNSVGQIVEVPRNTVDEDPERTCSQGLHFCSFSYLTSYASGGHRIMILKVHPKDVVAIPVDYQNAKARCCRYEVIGEYAGADDILGSRPVFSDNHFDTSDEYDFEEDCEEDYEEYDSGDDWHRRM